jgi:hypothetical protein
MKYAKTIMIPFSSLTKYHDYEWFENFIKVISYDLHVFFYHFFFHTKINAHLFCPYLYPVCVELVTIRYVQSRNVKITSD